MNTQLQPATELNRLKLAHSLYNSYGAMLLGFIFEIVKNQLIAEQYLIEVFNDVPNGLTDYAEKGLNMLSQLQMLARKKLEPFFETAKGCFGAQVVENGKIISNNKYIAQMTPDQKLVFCGIHYHGKSISILSIELNKPADEIRKLLKESFTLIRKSNGNTGLH